MRRVAVAVRQRLVGCDASDVLLAFLVIGLASTAESSSKVSAGVALLAALGLLWPTPRRRPRREPPDAAPNNSPETSQSEPPGARRRLFERRRTRFLVCVALASATLAVAGDARNFLTGWNVRVWNVYHYYLGAKYFQELGYTDLYDATLRADLETSKVWKSISRVRNLQTYAIESRRMRIKAYDPAAHFEPERWAMFQRDVTALAKHQPPHAWQKIFTDRGYNGTPFWTVIGGRLAHWVPADHRLAMKVLCSLDVVLFGATFILLGSTFGARTAACVLLLLTISPVNTGRFVGGFLQYDWFCAVVVGLCLYRRKWPVAAAGALAYAVLTRIFPVLFVVAAAVPVVARWVRDRRSRGRRSRGRRLPRRWGRFAVAFTLWCSLGLVISLANGRGVSAWSEFATGIRLHSEHHVFGVRRIGLKHAFTHQIGSFEFGRNNDRRESFEQQRFEYGLVATVLLAGFLAVAWHSRPRQAMLLALIPIFVLLVTSRYYASYLALLPMSGSRRGPPTTRLRWLTAGQLVVWALFFIYDALGARAYATYSVLNMLLAGFLAVVLVIHWQDLPLRRLRRVSAAKP